MPKHKVMVTLDSSGDLVCEPSRLEDVDRLDKVHWEAADGIGDWVVFFSAGAPVHPATASSLPAHPEEITIDKHATGHRRYDPARPDELKIKYSIAATVGGQLKECDPELIVKPG